MLGAPPGGVFGAVNVLCSSRSRDAATYAAQYSIDRSTHRAARSTAAAICSGVGAGGGNPTVSVRSMVKDAMGSVAQS